MVPSKYKGISEQKQYGKTRKKSKYFLYIIYNYYLGNISKEKLSDVSTYCSVSSKELDEIKTAKKTSKSLNANDFHTIYHSFSAKNLLNRITLFNLKNDFIFNNKYLELNIKDININPNSDSNTFQLKEIKDSNNIDNTVLKEKNNNLNNKINNNNASIPEDKESKGKKKNGNKNKIIIPKKKHKRKLESKFQEYRQDKDISCMANTPPPELPQIFKHSYNLESINNDNTINKNSSTAYGKINKELIPISFYNHLMMTERNSYGIYNNKKYIKNCITQRNKKKLLTIIYLTPKK